MRYATLSVATILAAGASLSLVSTAALARDYDEVRLGVDVPYEPFMYREADGTLTGFEIELGNAACASGVTTLIGALGTDALTRTPR